MLQCVVGEREAGHLTTHWEEEDGSTKTYTGCVIGASKHSNGLVTYKVRYHLQGLREESESVDRLMAEKLICDILFFNV